MDVYDYENLSGRVVLVTGGGRGLGAAICETLAREGAQVAVADINLAAAQKVANDITFGGHTAQAYAMDVNDERAISKVFDSIVNRFGHLDAIVNNAGVDVTVGIRQMEVADWHRVI